MAETITDELKVYAIDDYEWAIGTRWHDAFIANAEENYGGPDSVSFMSYVKSIKCGFDDFDESKETFEQYTAGFEPVPEEKLKSLWLEDENGTPLLTIAEEIERLKESGEWKRGHFCGFGD